MVHKLRWVCDENDHSIKKKTWLTHSTCAILHIKYLYLMCLCVQPVYHGSIVVRGRYRAGWLWDKTLVSILVQPSHFIANAQPVSETTIYWFCYYRYSRVMLRTQHCDLNLHSRIHTPWGALYAVMWNAMFSSNWVCIYYHAADLCVIKYALMRNL